MESFFVLHYFISVYHNFPAVASGCGYQGNISSGLQFESMVPGNAVSTSLFHSPCCMKELRGFMLLSTANTKMVNLGLWKNQYCYNGSQEDCLN